MTGREIRGDGTPEHAWRAWPGLERLPLCAAQSLPSGRVVFVAPHPDDEVLGAGGLLHELHRSGREILVVAVTDGEKSHAQSALVSPTQLARLRAAESAAALEALGLARAQTVRLGLPDGGVNARQRVLKVALGDVLQRGDCVIVTARNDGHPDHEATARATLRAACGKGARVLEVPVWMWHWARPGDARVAWNRARRIFPAQEALAAKRRAVDAFASQTTSALDAGLPPVLSRRALERLLRPFEVVFV